jgi:ATP-dependent DNA helicase RecG
MAQFRIARLPEHESLLIEAQAIANNLYTEDSARTTALISRWAGPRADFARV